MESFHNSRGLYCFDRFVFVLVFDATTHHKSIAPAIHFERVDFIGSKSRVIETLYYCDPLTCWHECEQLALVVLFYDM